MEKHCKQCAQNFKIQDNDLEFYKKINMPSPALCPNCREIRRLCFRNERNLYHRKCDLTGKPILSIYSQDKPYKVYQKDAWFSDKWDPFEYGKDFDFTKSFFEQFNELLLKTPHPAAGYNADNENCEFCTYQNHSKNCYLTFGSGWMEDCAYANWTYHAKDSFDCLGSDELELCYEITDCNRMYGCKFCQDCADLTDCAFCYDCHSCQNCFCCVGLRRKQFCLYNEQLSKEEYSEKIKNIKKEEAILKIENVKLKIPHRFCFQLNCENSTGDHLVNCKTVIDSFQDTGSQDCRYESEIIENKDCYDCNRTGLTELGYEICGGGFYYNNLFCVAGGQVKDSFYTFTCFNSDHLFGCVSLKKNKYCILNKQYSEEKYFEMVKKIIEHMKKTGEYGEFFPKEISPFCYNETLANDYYALEEKEAIAKGYKWKAKDKKDYLSQKIKFPDDIEKVDESILNEILACEACGKNYKLIDKELKFYKKIKSQIPHKCPDCRHKDRIFLRNPHKLWARKCSKCGVEINSTYSPNRPEKVYCEKCYLETIG
ncbi:MAG: hypothetical protein WC806_01180 [Candidatus Gracilibacteria bacterium]|jgi:Zn ribbon nucleic-acid-binding protein